MPAMAHLLRWGDKGARYGRVSFGQLWPDVFPSEETGTIHMSYFIPPKRDDYRAWLLEFKDQIAIVGPGLGLTPERITAIQTTCTNQIRLIDEAKTAEDAATLATKKETEQRIITNAALQEEIKVIKASSAYGEAEAAALHIKSSKPSALDPATYKPTFKLHTTTNGNLLTWPKKGVDAMKVNWRIKGQPVFTHFGTFTGKSCLDSHPLATPHVPETREYQLIGMINDQEIGVPSDIQSALWDGE
jgi:hypothetical protein